MVDALSHYAISVICASFLMNIVQMILPSGHIKKYVVFICGVILTIIFVSPVISFFQKDFDVSQILRESESLQLEIEEKKYEEVYTNEVVKSYKKNIEGGIVKRLKQVGYTVHEINVEYDEITLEPKYLRLTIESSDGTIQPVRIEVSSKIGEENQMISHFEILKLENLLKEEYGFERVEING